MREQEGRRNLVAALLSEVWQNIKRTSFSDFAKEFLPDMKRTMVWTVNR